MTRTTEQSGTLTTEQSGEDSVLTYSVLRRMIGGAGLVLPVVLLVTGWIDHKTQASMSAYYYTNIGNYFTGTMCVIGVFLIAYRYRDGKSESWITSVAGLAALGVAFFHCTPHHPTPRQLHLAVVHLSCAGTLFAILGFVSFWYFASNVNPQRPREKALYYRLLGLTIWVSIALMIVWNAGWPSFYDRNHLLFWLETVCVVAFSSSFLLKGHFSRPVPDAPALKATVADVETEPAPAHA